MATVTSGGYWRPTNRVGTGEPDPNAPRAQPTPAALGIPPQPTQAPMAPTAPTETDEERKRRTGVDPGGAGYVSGQVAPGTGTSALAALGGTAPTGPTGNFARPPAAPPPPAGNPWRPAGFSAPAPTPTGTGWRARGYGDTATTSSALTAGAPPAGDDTVSTTSSLTNTSGTQNKNQFGAVGDAVGKVPIAGDIISNFTSPSSVDLSPGLNAQRAAFGISDDLDKERYEYRPGDAPSMDIDSDIRQKQLEALGGLRAAATGAVPSAAELQMRREAGRNVAATLGQARALGARSAGGAARAGTLASADILGRSNLEGAQLRASEQERARAAEVAALGGVRGQDTDISGANLRAQLDTNQLAENHRLKLLEARLTALGIGSQTIASILGAAKANADSENKFRGGILDSLGI